MDKSKIFQMIIDALESELNTMIDAAKNNREAATHEESRAENKYDTRGLEASYLAGAQAKRAKELQDLILLYKGTMVQNYNSKTPIDHTALVELSYQGQKKLYFLAPKEGGKAITYNKKEIFVVSPNSPIGEALMGRLQGDEFDIEINDEVRDYKILTVY